MKIANDSARTYDADGRLHVASCRISKATVNPYFGGEIPNWQELGLDAERVYQIYRDADALAAAAPTFAGLPILDEHIPTSADDPQKEAVIGAIGSNVSFDGTYLTADLTFWDGEAIKQIETNSMRELSCSYYWTPEMTPGKTPDGLAYDGAMRDIRGNHLALVQTGRAGHDVLVADSNPKGLQMKVNKQQKLAIAAFSGISKKLAGDSALPAAIVSTPLKSLRDKLLSMDGELDAQQIDNVIDALLDVEQPEPAAPQQPEREEVEVKTAEDSPAEKIKALLQGKIDSELLDTIVKLLEGGAEMPAAQDAEEIVKTACDSLRSQLLAAHRAALECRQTVGDVALDSAGAVYGMALDALKIEHAGISDEKALRAMYKLAIDRPVVPVTDTLASDKAAVAAMPGVARIKLL